MKKLLLILLCLLLCSCHEVMSPSDAMAYALTNAHNSPKDYHIYYSDADEESPHFPTKDIKEKLYTDGYDIDALCEDYAILIGNGTVPYEIHLLRARSHSNLTDILSCLRGRKDLLTEHKNSTFHPDTEERTEQALCYCSGKYAVLLVTDDNDALRELLSDCIL